MVRESRFEAHVIRRLNRDFPGCFVVKNDSGLIQGIPDRTVFFEDKWAMLEVKESANAPEQPNQGYYVELFDRMSFAAFIYPENEEDVFDALQRTFQPRRVARVSQR
jgi:hypothetical protein